MATRTLRESSSSPRRGNDGEKGKRIVNVNVGVLGHVDCGKTSLVKSLSTHLSTAALDKSCQSRQRGITLDLGFSAFLLPPRECDAVQVTLVDCPGHASLIRTIIGGAQIIDMVLLVVDASKGIQTQTAECLLIAEMTTRHLLVVLNKVDLLRDQTLDSVQKKIRAVLQGTTRFADAPMIGVSACVGGEKKASDEGPEPQTHNIGALLSLLQSTIVLPDRATSQHAKNNLFHFSIDHCFPIKGQGTVLTGTVLAGSLDTGDSIEFPTLAHVTRKVKSIQMFKQPVSRIRQGDRAGLCIANLDPKLLERGIACSPGGYIVMLLGAIVIVKKVRYFRGKLENGAKFHVTVGHSTVTATVTFFGARELHDSQNKQPFLQNKKEECDESSTATGTLNEKTMKKNSSGVTARYGSSSLGGNADIAGLPRIPFDYDQHFLYQKEYMESLEEDDEVEDAVRTNGAHRSPLHWAILEFQSPVYCPLDSLIIGSRLDTATANMKTCRLAFSGRIIQKFDPKTDLARLSIYTCKEKCGIVCRLGDAYKLQDGTIVRHEIFGTDLFKKETSMTSFIGLKVETHDTDEVGVIQSSFGTTGKFKVYFPAGTCAKEGDTLYLRFRKYSNEVDKKKIRQDEHLILPPPRVGTRYIEVVEKKKRPKSKKKKKMGSNPTATNNEEDGGCVVVEDEIKKTMNTTMVDDKVNSNNNNNNDESKVGKEDVSTRNGLQTTTTTTQQRIGGEITAIKGDVLEDGTCTMVIVTGLFTPECNIRDSIGNQVIVSRTKEIGVIHGSFGKAGKCKVSFAEHGTKARIGDAVELFP